jgi:hypothetical protein
MPSLRKMKSQAKAEEKAEAAKLRAELEAIAGQLLYGDRCILVELMNHPGPISDPNDDLALYTLNDLGLLEIESVAYTETYSLSRLGKQVAEFIVGLPYHQFINVGEDFVGPKFDENRPLKETAKLIKKEILECERQGILLKGKWSVRTEGYTIYLKFTSKHIHKIYEHGPDPNIASIVYCLTLQYNKYQGPGSFEVFATHIKEE